MDIKSEVFSGMSLGDLLGDIYKHTDQRRRTINKLIETISKTVTNQTEAEVLGPLLKGYVELDIKNEDNLVKVAQVIQRAIAASSIDSMSEESAEGVSLSEDDKKALLAARDQLMDEAIRGAEEFFNETLGFEGDDE